ncbi:MAG: hypothetical protein CL398_11645 [Acidiferrobacteraceae bacterium]|nr:hypothetical protein [Acidiferrobacteraceae bacterium]
MRDENNTRESKVQDKNFFDLLQDVLGEVGASQVENDWVLSQQKKELAIDEHYDRIAEAHEDGMVLVNPHTWAEVW